MFSERLEATLTNPSLASPSRLARLATSEEADTETVSKVQSQITTQCHTQRSLDPLFRFMEASLEEFFERSRTQDIITIMSEERPHIFDITCKFRQLFGSVNENALDSNRAHDISLKNLLYILRCQMSEERLYRPLTGVAGTGDYDAVRIAKLNFARLYKQCDVVDILPKPALGLIRSSYPMAPLPIPSHTRTAVAEMVARQQALALDALSQYSRFFVIYVSNYGISEAVSLPTLSIILADLTSPLSVKVVSHLKELFDPFSLSALLLRLASGEFKPVGEIWYYPRVPLGSSISGGDDDIAGTLGGFCRNKLTGEVYGLTAAHVVGTSRVGVFAPASKPYNAAAKSLEIRVKDIEKVGKGDTIWSNKLSELKNLDRFYGASVFSSQTCTNENPGRIIDAALLQIHGERFADNRIGKIHPSLFPEFTEEGDKIVALTSAVQPGEVLWKYGIRTALTSGTNLDTIIINWDANNVTRADDKVDGSLCTASAILGQWDPSDGTFTDFAKPGDSGSFVLRVVRDPLGFVESEAVVIRTEGAGILYGIVWEEKYHGFVALYMMMEDVFKAIREGTGIEVDLEVPDAEAMEWPCTIMGRGPSTYGLH